MILRTVKRAVKRGLSSSLGWRVAGAVVRRPGVIVLMYHRILGADRALVGLPAQQFATQMRWVRDNCDPIHPDQLVERARRPSRVRPAVLVTFDDGYRDYHDLAYPILKELRIPSVVFLATSFLDQGGMIWTDQVQWAAVSTKKSQVKLPWSGEVISLPDAAARDALGGKARGHLKKLPDPQRQALLGPLLEELGPVPARERQMLTWDEVRATQDLTCYGGHSHTHPILSKLDRASAEQEIGTCQERIAAETGRRARYFAYPNGRPGDYTGETQEILRNHGFEVAFSTSEGVAGADSDWMAIKRFPGEAENLADFAWLAAGLMRS
jgi:peptidoglycan/xylan/chitin deacetylase (PgdA/CDA1 family)